MRTAAELRAAVVESLHRAARDLPAGDVPTIGFVPTMGALHSGHGALLRAARESADLVVASVFVNPLQFDDDADYLHYPRQLDADLELLEAHGADIVFAPEVEEMYPGYPGSSGSPVPLVRLTAGELGRRWEGAARPGHFDGVVTVVSKLFSIIAGGMPARVEAWFGEKDAEQVAIIRRMVADLNHPVTVRALPIVRDENGLALSSRNQRLSAEDYPAALTLSRALAELARRAAAGRPLDVEELIAGLNADPGVDLDYLVAVDPSTLLELEPGMELLAQDGVLRGEALALIAARVGPVRLIDNMSLQVSRPIL